MLESEFRTKWPSVYFDSGKYQGWHTWEELDSLGIKFLGDIYEVK